MNAIPPDPASLPRQRGLALGSERHRVPPAPRRIASRRRAIATAKRLLPLAAVALLASVVMWPEISRWADQARMHAGRLAARLASGLLIDPIYHGVDERGRPYTVTAVSARQVSPDRVDLVQPKGDATLEGGRWLMVQARQGVYMRHQGNMDLSGDVILYRDDGTTLTTDTANLDLHSGTAAGADRVHVEGPFGTLDAQGFTVSDRGTAMQFAGPARLILNARR